MTLKIFTNGNLPLYNVIRGENMSFSNMFEDEKDLKESILQAYKKWKMIFHKKKFDIEKKKNDFASQLSQEKRNQFFNILLDYDQIQNEDLRLLIEFIFTFIMVSDFYDDKSKPSGNIFFD